MSTVSSLAGQAAVGQYVTSPWWTGAREVTQGWGASGYAGEPAGHGYKHWHAGADVGIPCGSVLTLPAEIHSATARAVDNPQGYGTALVLTIGDVDLWFGHLAARLVKPGPVRGGQAFAITNSSGNSTGCHLHFEVRPRGAKYGADVDPSQWLLDPVGAAGAGAAYGDSAQQAGADDPVSAALQGLLSPISDSINAAERQLVAGLVGSAQVGLGGLLMLGGSAAIFAGIRGQSFQQARSRAVGFVRGKRREVAAADVKERTGAEQTAKSTAREQAREALLTRRETIGRYRAGLISKAEAQRRLGEPVRPTGKRPSEVAFGGREPGVYRLRQGKRVKMVDVKGAAPAAAHRAARARASRIKGARMPEAAAASKAPIPQGPSASYSEIPF